MIKHIFKNELFFTIIYALSNFSLILFYCLSESREIVYPLLLSFFFYFAYLCVSFGYTYVYIQNINRLSLGSKDFYSFNMDRKYTYDVINDLHKKYNTSLTNIKRREEENRRFISSCVHNLKTPLTVSNLLLQRVDNKEISYDEAFKGLKEENERLSEALSMILETQRLEEFVNDYEPVKMNLYEEVEKIINESKSLFINSHLFPVLKGNEVFVFFDEKWNKVMLKQIISNAVKYSKDSTDRHLYFEIKVSEKEVVLEVKDNGIGISEYDLPKVFDAFFTGENGRKNYYSSGIGLYLCKMICQKLGQKIEIESKKGKGTTVKISYLTKL